jgi:hypothetical protein
MAKGHSTSRLGDKLTGLGGDEPEHWENCLDWPDPFVVFEDSPWVTRGRAQPLSEVRVRDVRDHRAFHRRGQQTAMRRIRKV